MDKGIVLRDKERSLYMNPIDKDIKELFIILSEQEHCSHYGNCLKWCVEQALEYQKVKEVLLNTDLINNILGDKPEIETEEEKPDKEIKMLSGRKMQGGKEKDE